MELIILGEKKDPRQEIEIFSKDFDCPHGFNVIITHKEKKVDGVVYTKEGEITTCHNVTEYHHLWESLGGSPKDRLACESDIHFTGYVPWDIFDDFSKVEVVKADREHKGFYEE